MCAAIMGLSSWLGAGRRVRIVAAALGLAGFVTVVGPDPSVQRATVMATVLLVSNFGGKRSASLPALGLAVIVLLALDPWQALHPGFALSVAATAGILLAAAPITATLERRSRLPHWLALSLAVALAAQFACAPLLLLLQPGVPVIGVLANVVAAPAAPLGTGIGLLAALLAPASSELAHVAVLLASWPARWVAATAHVTAELPLGRWIWPEGWGGALLLALCQCLLLTAWALRSGRLTLPRLGSILPRQPWQARPVAPRPIAVVSAALASAAMALILSVTLITPLADRLTSARGWSVVACDVGQGDALLLRDPASPKQVMLVDTGDDAELLQQCLNRFGVSRISLLVLSHDDRDHVGAVAAVLDRVDGALVSPTPAGEQIEQRAVLQQLEAARVPYQLGTAGLTSASEGGEGPDWLVLAPDANHTPAHRNAASLVMLVGAGPASVLLLGDTGAEEQGRLLRAGLPLAADIVKVAHHGSRDQDHALPAAVRADWALVSVGVDNGYGHPSRETVSAHTLAGTRALRTDQHGSIALIPQPDGSLEAWLERVG